MADKSAKSLADPLLLETIDKLFQHNIGEYVSLPQVSLYDHLVTRCSEMTLV